MPDRAFRRALWVADARAFLSELDYWHREVERVALTGWEEHGRSRAPEVVVTRYGEVVEV